LWSGGFEDGSQSTRVRRRVVVQWRQRWWWRCRWRRWEHRDWVSRVLSLPGSPPILSCPIVSYPCIKRTPISEIHLATVFRCDPHRPRLQVCRHTAFFELSGQEYFLDRQAVQAQRGASRPNSVGHAIRSHWWRCVRRNERRPTEVVELLRFGPQWTPPALRHYKCVPV
jgi:hypothetical protein